MTQQLTLFERLGGADNLRTIVNDIVDAHLINPLIGTRFSKLSSSEMEASKQHAFEFFAAGTGGPFEYTGKDLRTTHSGMNISEQEFLAVVDDVVSVLTTHGVGPQEQQEVLYALYSLKGDVIRL
jgi:hemoglobin